MARTPTQVLPARHLAPGPRRATVPWRRHRHGDQVPLPRLPHPDPVDTINPVNLTAAFRGEPGAVRVARRVRRAARGNGTVATPSPRPGPTRLATRVHQAHRRWRPGPEGADRDGGPHP